MKSTPPPWEFKLLGGIRIKHQGQVMSLPPYRCQPLLALLLLHPRQLSRLELIGQLFPDLPEAKGRRYISERLWSLRKVLPELPIDARNDSVFLRGESRQLDVDRFHELLAMNEHESNQAAASIYGGDLLPAHYDEWILLERESLRLRYVRLLHELAGQYEQRGQTQRSLATLQQLHRIEPMDELVVQRLMELYARLGRRSASLEVYEKYQSTLAELDLAPSEQLDELSERLVRTVVSPAASSRQNDLPDEGEYYAKVRKLLRQAAWQDVERLLGQVKDASEAEVVGWRFDLALAREETEQAKRWLARLTDDEPSTILRRAQYAVHRANHEKAVELLTGLLLARGEDVDDVDSWLLHHTLANAKLGLGELSEAQASALAANRLADRIDDPYNEASSALLSGRIRLLQGDHDGAADLLENVVQLAGDEGFQLLAARAYYWLSVVASQRGHLQEHLGSIELCLKLVRDLELPNFEIRVLNKLAFANDQLGRHNESLRALTQARLLLEAMDDPRGTAETLYNTAASISWHDKGNFEFGLALARKALEFYRSVGAKGWQASCHSQMAILQWRAGRFKESLDHYFESYQRHGELGEIYYQKNLLGEIAIVLVELDRIDEAIEYARKGLLFVQQDGQGDDFEVLNYYAAGLAYAADGQTEQAHKYYRRAFEKMLSLASGISEPTLKMAFLNREEVYRRVLRAVRREQLAELPPELKELEGEAAYDRMVGFEGSNEGMPRLARSDGSIALRRQRLQELRAKAASQGQDLTVGKLADRLGVSKRTVQRDLAFLRQHQ